MLRPEYTTQFKKDLFLCQKRNFKIELLKEIITLITQETTLPEKHKEHWLKGNHIGYKECHILPDWLLIYQIKDEIVVFVRTGTHSDLFYKVEYSFSPVAFVKYL